MSPDLSEIRHVSDTALMVAACRALERTRPYGMVDDPFAERLAGERGHAILKALPVPELMCFGVAVRSRFLDGEVLYAANELKVETVLCLGAGLDTRPWRLDLPASLRWIEVDFPEMLDYKHGILAAMQAEPRCQLQRMAADLNDAAARAAIWRAVGPAPALMITEGLLMYLPGATVEALAAESAAQCGLRFWLMDLTSPEFAKRIGMASYTAITQVRAEDHINGARLLEILSAAGWTAKRRHSNTTDAYAAAPERIKELMAMRPANAPPPPPPLPATDPSGVNMFERA
jgi:methyltransferase (TIGR00027 family)